MIIVSSQQQRSKRLFRAHGWSRSLWGAFSGKESATQLWGFLRGVLIECVGYSPPERTVVAAAAISPNAAGSVETGE